MMIGISIEDVNKNIVNFLNLRSNWSGQFNSCERVIDDGDDGDFNRQNKQNKMSDQPTLSIATAPSNVSMPKRIVNPTVKLTTCLPMPTST